MSDKMNDSEKAFAEWMDSLGIYYIYLEQSQGSYSNGLNKDSIKRPDFLVGFPDLGVIAVDIKDREKTIINEHKRIFLDFEDFRRALNFERSFHIPFWYAITSRKINKYLEWYFISVRKVLYYYSLDRSDTDENRYLFYKTLSNGDKEYYFSLPYEGFKNVNKGSDIRRIFLPGL